MNSFTESQDTSTPVKGSEPAQNNRDRDDLIVPPGLIQCIHELKCFITLQRKSPF